jgi:ABC-2 type transport system permease protein
MMGHALTIARREMRSYFDQPTAYVLIVAFLGISLFIAFRTMYATGVASLRPIFDLLPVLFAIFVPAATMRSLAEERRGKTLDWLMAQPITEGELVLGKFLGSWAFVLLALAGTIPTALGILAASDADGGIVLAQYIGATLLAGQLTAVGVWASSMTRNQITAFIVASATSFTLFLIGLPLVQIGLPPSVSGALAQLSVLGHFENVARGVVDLRDVLYFVSTAGLFVTLAWAAVARERLSRSRQEFGRMRIGSFVVLGLVIVLNLAGSRIRGRIDLTADNLYTLSSGTRDLLGDLDDLVQIKLFASSTLPPEIQLQLRDVRDLLADMRRASNGNLIVTEVDPDDDEDAVQEAGELGIFPVEFNVLRDDNFEVRQGYYGFAIVYADQNEVTPLIQRTDDLEFRVASQIYEMTTDERPGIAFLSGYGAKSVFQIPGLQQSLGERYDIRSVDLASDSLSVISRDSTEVIVIAGAMQPLSESALGRVRDFVDAGGAALLLIEPVLLDAQSPMPTASATGVEGLIQDRGLAIVPGLVADLVANERVSLGQQGAFNRIAPYPLWPITMASGEHSVTNGLNSLTLGWASALKWAEETEGITPLWETTEAGAISPLTATIMPDQDWFFPEEEQGVQVVAAAVLPNESDSRGRMIVVGDASFAEPQYVQANRGNVLFLANAIDWLAQDEALINIRSKDRTPPGLVFESDGAQSFLNNLLGIPVLVVLLGSLRVTGRRRRAEARWGELIHE